MTWEGAFTALATPFADDGSVDEAALRALVRYQVDGGITGLVACGTTGETPTLADPERLRIVEVVLDEVAGRCPVIAGAGGNDTAHVCGQAKDMAELGVTGLLSVSPYYNRPTQPGLVAHFSAVADATDLPVILYNVPGRTGGRIAVETAIHLAAHPRIVGIKEASGDISAFDALLAQAPDGFTVLSGDDALTFPAMCLGAAGVISVVSNLEPTRMQRLVEAVLRGDQAEGRRLHRELSPLMAACFLTTNPAPVKTGLSLLGMGSDRMRLPLVPPPPEVRAEMVRCLQALGHDIGDSGATSNTIRLA